MPPAIASHPLMIDVVHIAKVPMRTRWVCDRAREFDQKSHTSLPSAAKGASREQMTSTSAPLRAFFYIPIFAPE
jgi:hypothetical protein